MVVTSAFDILSVVTGLLAGYYLGKWDSRGSDMKVFDELAYQVSKFLVSVKAGYVGKPAEKVEIDKFKQQNFGSFPEPLKNDRRSSLVKFIVYLIVAIFLFALPRIFG